MTFTGDRFVKVPSLADAITSAAYFCPYLDKLKEYTSERMVDRLRSRELRPILADLFREDRKSVV